jgi:hypothetical protein
MENSNLRGAVTTAAEARLKKAAGTANKPVTLIVLAILILSASAFAQSLGTAGVKSANPLATSTLDLAGAARQYKASLEALLPIYERAFKVASKSLDERKELFAQGVVSRRDLEASLQARQEAQAQVEETRRQITEADQLLVEAVAERDPVKPDSSPRPTATLRYRTTNAIRSYSGSGAWSLAQAAQVQSFFASMFGRQLPISAYGQSATHNRMGFDHRNSMDVALHPDSAEGKALIAYLRGNGIPHLVFRSAVSGAATGAHIHVGYPSHRR